MWFIYYYLWIILIDLSTSFFSYLTVTLILRLLWSHCPWLIHIEGIQKTHLSVKMQITINSVALSRTLSNPKQPSPSAPPLLTPCVSGPHPLGKHLANLRKISRIYLALDAKQTNRYKIQYTIYNMCALRVQQVGKRERRGGEGRVTPSCVTRLNKQGNCENRLSRVCWLNLGPCCCTFCGHIRRRKGASHRQGKVEGSCCHFEWQPKSSGRPLLLAVLSLWKMHKTRQWRCPEWGPN